MNNREIIHEFVNMARHPEAKDLAEALNEEAKIFGCLVDCSMGYDMPPRKITPIIDFNFYNEPFVAINNNAKLSNVYKNNHKILGRPITAFDVCWALEKNFKKNWNGMEKHYPELQIKFFAEPNIIHLGRTMGSMFHCFAIIEYIKQDGTYTTLDEWSDEVCDRIAELINL